MLLLEPKNISVCIINKDGEYWLDQCLSSLPLDIGEIVFLDTGSADKSMEIASDHGAKVSEIAWPDDFSLARNECLKKAAKPWILTLDTDEILFSDDLEQALNLLNSESEMGVGFETRHYEPFSGRWNWKHSEADSRLNINQSGYRTTHNIKLFPNHEKVYWIYPVHESVVPSLKELNIPLRFTEIPVHHLGYAELDDAGRAARIARNLSLGKRKIEDYPDCPEGFLELGELVMEYGDINIALRLLHRAVELSGADPKICMTLAEAYICADDNVSAQKLLHGLVDTYTGRKEIPSFC